MRYTLAFLLLTTTVAVAEPPSGWLEFRGAGGTSAVPAGDIPVEWDVDSGKNVAWRADLPGRGVSSPIVVDGRVIVTASDGLDRTKLHVLAFDTESGRQLWHRQSWATGRTQCHPTSANAAPTPASDGERIYAFYSSNDLICYDLDGNLLWYRGLVLDHPRLGNDVGMSSSPVVGDGVVVVMCECQGDSFAAGFDCQSGETLWQVKRPPGSNWASPVIAQFPLDGKRVPSVLLQGDDGLHVYALANGKPLWSNPGIKGASIPSAAAFADLLLVPGDGLTAISMSSSREPQVMWSNDSMKPGNPSPLMTGDGVCVISRAGVIMLADPATGETTSKKRIGGSYWATPVAVGSLLYALDDRGNMNVIDLSQGGDIVAKNSFGDDEETLGSPAVAGNAIYVRSHKHLWKIAKTND